MKVSRRIAVIAAREARRFIAIAAERSAPSASIHRHPPSFRPLSDSETEAYLGVELPMALSGVRPQ